MLDIAFAGFRVDTPGELLRGESTLPEDEGEVVGHFESRFAFDERAFGEGRLHGLGVVCCVGRPEEGGNNGGGFDACADEEEESGDVADLVVKLASHRQLRLR